MKRLNILLSVVIILALVSGLIFVFVNRAGSSCPIIIKTTDECIQLELADTDRSRTVGLSGRPTMPDNQGMLFDFQKSSEVCMWMKDMKFNLDIIWLDATQKITKIEKNIEPNTYPKSFCDDNSAYVIELNAGVAELAGLSEGQLIKL